MKSIVGLFCLILMICACGDLTKKDADDLLEGCETYEQEFIWNKAAAVEEMNTYSYFLAASGMRYFARKFRVEDICYSDIEIKINIDLPDWPSGVEWGYTDQPPHYAGMFLYDIDCDSRNCISTIYLARGSEIFNVFTEGTDEINLEFYLVASFYAGDQNIDNDLYWLRKNLDSLTVTLKMDKRMN